jgi:hypothetical protein
MSNTIKRKQLAERLLGANEPKLTEGDRYTSSLIIALNHYNSENDDKDKQKWFVSYVAQTDKKLAVALLKLDPHLFRHAGIIARLVMREQPVAEKELSFLQERTAVLTEFTQKPEPVKVVVKDDKPVAPVISLQDRIEAKARELAGDFDGAIDDFVLEDKSFDAKDLMKRLNASGPVAKIIGSFYVNTVEELNEAIEGKDPQLVEGYSNFKKAKLKKLAALYQSIIDAAGAQVQVAKATRKPRQRKEKPAGVIVAKMKYKKEDTEYAVKSVPASGIVNAQELWVFNSKYRKLQVYRAIDPKGLSVKGTSIVGYDPDNSGSKTMRKPEQISVYATLTKRPLNQAFKSLTTQEQNVNGRINEECILLKVFQ